MKNNFVKKEVLGVGVTDASYGEILEFILTGLEKQTDPYYVVTPNPEILVYADRHKDFKNILNGAKLALNDGVGVSLAATLLGRPLKSRVTGVDLVEKLCKEASKRIVTTGFLGGREGVAELAAECLVKKYPGLRVGFVGEEWLTERFRIKDLRFKNEKNQIVNHKSYILNHGIDILFVAFGFPKQEEWMAKNINKLPVRVMIGVGGSFDYISGRIPRAPVFIRKIGFEWLFRLVREPWRIKRQLALVEFVWRVVFRHQNV